MVSLVQKTTPVKLGNVTNTNAGGSITGVTAGDTLVFVAVGYNNADKLPTDSAGQTWVKAGFVNGGSALDPGLGIYYLLNANAGTHTLTWLAGDGPGGGGYCGTWIEEHVAATFDAAGAGLQINTGNVTTATTSVTAVAASGFAIGVLALDTDNGQANAAIVNTSGWTSVATDSDTSSDASYNGSYLDFTSSGSKSITWTFNADPSSGANRVAALAVSFNTGGGGGASVAATGQTATTSTGTVKPALAVAAAGQSATFTPGTVRAALSKAITGGSITSSAGTVTPSISVALTGQTINSSTGTVSPPGTTSVALTGQTITSAQGAVGQALAVPLTGSTVTSSQGTVVPQSAGTTTVAITGQTIAASQGALGKSLANALTGQTSSFSQGAVAFLRRDVTVALTGQTIAITQGTVSPPAPPTTARNMGFSMGPQKRKPRLERSVRPQSDKARERFAAGLRKDLGTIDESGTGPAEFVEPTYGGAFEPLRLRNAGPLAAPSMLFPGAPAWMDAALMQAHQRQQAAVFHVEQQRRKRAKDDEDAVAALLAAG